ncbi:hypothetical protein P353_14890 [Comamonas testosteroni]|uniref:Uncharacterized protein n=1 Tax=Comamonas testosteroni TaxID=285 RepID=A0A096FFJ3_COMTE|nr:hypothetical protein P353_14890 [Comamonas testosteroni]
MAAVPTMATKIPPTAVATGCCRVALAFLLSFRTYFSDIFSILLAVNKRVLMHLTGEIEKQDSDLTESSLQPEFRRAACENRILRNFRNA